MTKSNSSNYSSTNSSSSNGSSDTSYGYSEHSKHRSYPSYSITLSSVERNDAKIMKKIGKRRLMGLELVNFTQNSESSSIESSSYESDYVSYTKKSNYRSDWAPFNKS